MRGWSFHTGSSSAFAAPGAGEKLIEHLKAWLEPEKLAAQECAWSPGQAPEIAAAILELFHLLPPQAAGFLHSKGAGAVDCSADVLPCCWHAYCAVHESGRHSSQ